MVARKRNLEAESAAKARWMERRAERAAPGRLALALHERPARELALELGKRPFRVAAQATKRAAAHQLRRAGGWWDDNRTIVAVGVVSAFFGFAMWSAYLNAQEKNRAAASGHKTGWWPELGPPPPTQYGSPWELEALAPGAFHAPADPHIWDPLGNRGRFGGFFR